MDVIDESIFKRIPFQYLFGNEDEYYSKEKINELELTLNAKGIHPNFIEFNGGHKIYEETLQKLITVV
jgi:predicted esterase